MLAKIVAFSVRFRGVVLVLAVLMMVYGVYQLNGASLDIFPEFAPKQVIIQTESQGFTAKQVEALITQPLENVLGGLPDVDFVDSASTPGLSVITLTFDDKTDIYRNRQLVDERLAGLKDIVPEFITPAMVPLESSSGTIMTIGLTSDSQDLMSLRSVVDYALTPRLLAVPGVADINVFGGEVKQLQIQPDLPALQQLGLTIQDVTTAARQATGLHGVGYIENSNQRIMLTVTGQPNSADEMAKVVVKHQGENVILLGDVATITMAAAPTIGGAAVSGQPAIVMMVIGQYKGNTLSVTQGVEAALREFQKGFESDGIVLHDDLFRPANYIQRSLSNIQHHLFVGGGLVLLVLFLFLFNFRTALISITAIPLSLMAAIIVLLEMGVNLNIMVLGGLAIALGEVVDDAIIDTENIFRRLRENALLSEPKSVTTVVYEASMEVRSSVVYASFIVMLAFVPLLTLSGVAGRMFEPLGEAYILAIFASLLVALTVTPALCHLMLGKLSHTKNGEPPLIRWLTPKYGHMLGRICQFPKITFMTVLVLCIGGISVLPFFGSGFLPELREGHYIIHTTSIAGTSVESSLQIGGQIERRIAKIPGVRATSQWAGRAERGADTYGTHYSEYEVDLEPDLNGQQQQAILDEIREILSEFPGIASEVNSFLVERIDETISGYTSPIVVNLFGKNLDVLDSKAREVAAVMAEIRGASDIQIRAPVGEPQLQVRLKLDQLAFWGLRPTEIMTVLKTAYDGMLVGHVSEDNRQFETVVVLPKTLRHNPHQILTLPVRTLTGGIIPLSEVVELSQVSDRHAILHKGGQRLQTVTCNLTGRDLSSFFDELRKRIHEQVTFSAEVYPEFTGAAVVEAESRSDLLLHSLLASIGVMLLIYVALRSFPNMILVLMNLPFSLLGGVVAVLITGGVLSIGSLVGFVTLFGITLRNSIMLVSHYHYLVEKLGKPWQLSTAIQGAQERLPSILITALVTALAMLPIAIDADNPGREIMGPMAAIIIGGLVTSTLLNLLVLPAIMLRFGVFNSNAHQTTHLSREG
ncbi:Cobalt-zinc-cadmium resistance protein CzcA, Cation efflux system protein CusA [Methylophaga frappieri]|uniref:Cobalt-zinc-cadmium resistance protein CzcA, Cation efflux system protein CusA n=1 Tax=Methylophaga frappieri (strain ATCC BAA-2434 / DSM 25690 / JAM7) TaxID=754477 RepID=I1YIS6_METFJ|nr:efflux RND transporter permease subunit [Methylophaga frappieri]AFJ02819.1 Cobalt-zinc-cadmium resistance protein CzcA, Cation efflux system protein CusA [Methylophaga frappieri]